MAWLEAINDKSCRLVGPGRVPYRALALKRRERQEQFGGSYPRAWL
jgi:hypothetical protein